MVYILAACVVVLLIRQIELKKEMREFKRSSGLQFKKIDRELDAIVEQFYILENDENIR